MFVTAAIAKATLRSLSDNWFWNLLSFLVQFEILLSVGMMSGFWLKPGHFHFIRLFFNLNLFCLAFSDIVPAKQGRVSLCCCLGGRSFPRWHLLIAEVCGVSHYCLEQVEVGGYLLPAMDESPSFPLGLLWHHHGGGVGTPRHSLSTWPVGIGREPYFFFCGIWLEWSCYCHKFSVLPGCPFQVLWLERVGSCWVLDFLSAPIGISGLLVSSAPSLQYMKQTKKPGKLSHVVFPPQAACPGLVCLLLSPCWVFSYVDKYIMCRGI